MPGRGQSHISFSRFSKDQGWNLLEVTKSVKLQLGAISMLFWNYLEGKPEDPNLQKKCFLTWTYGEILH